MLNHDEIVGKLAWLYELQNDLERGQQNLLTLYKERGLLTTNGDFSRIKGILNTLDRIKSASKELSELLGDEIQNIEVPGENYTFLYIPKGKPIITTHDYGSGQVYLPGDRCHVFKIYLKDENDDPDLV